LISIKKLIILIYDYFLKICIYFRKIYLIIIINSFSNNFIYKKYKSRLFNEYIFNKNFKTTKPICYTIICYLKKIFLIDSSILWIGLLVVYLYFTITIINTRIYKFWINNLMFNKKIINVKMASFLFKKSLSKINIKYPVTPVMLELLKFWNLAESIYYSPNTSIIFKTWFHSGKFFIIKFFNSIKLKISVTNTSWNSLKKSYKRWFIIKFYYFLNFDLNMNVNKMLTEYKTKNLKINIKDSLNLQEQIIYSRFHYFDIIVRLSNFDFYFQSHKLLILCYVELAKNLLKKTLILFKNIIINGLFQKIEYSKKNMKIFIIQIPKIISKEIEKSTMHLIDIKMIYFIGFLLRYTNIEHSSIILARPYYKENKFRVILRCKYLVYY